MWLMKLAKNKILVVAVVLIAGLAYWSYQGIQSFQAYQVAVHTLADRDEIRTALGPYEISYDWWFGVFRALRYQSVQEFEFHLNGRSADAIAVVNLQKSRDWNVTCVNVVNGEYLNNRIVQ